ncbi:MAG TPA: hypothetical protein VIL48_20700 [Acidimicrobiales bacterium]
MRTSSPCTWFPWCTRPVARAVERRTADGVVLREAVCERHLPHARDHGFVPVEGEEHGPDGRRDHAEPAGRDGRDERAGRADAG